MTDEKDLKGLMDDFTVTCRNKECTYWFNNWSILVTPLVMGRYVFLGQKKLLSALHQKYNGGMMKHHFDHYSQ